MSRRKGTGMMKTSLIIGSALFGALFGSLLLATPSEAITVEEVLAKHVEAKGGEAAWKSVTSLRVSGSHTAFGNSGEFTLSRQRPNASHFLFKEPKGRTVIAYTGETAWSIDRVAGNDWGQPTGTVDSAVIAAEADFAGALLDREALGHTVTLIGQGDFDGEDTYQLEVQRKDGGKETWYLSSDTFLEFARVAPASDYGRPIAEGRTYFLDFRRVGDVVLPHHIEKEYGTRLRISTIDTVTINPGFPKGFFDLELPRAQKKLAPLAGKWQVKVESRSHPRAPWQETTTTTTIESRFHGALLVEELKYELDGRMQEISHHRSFDRYKGVYTETFFDNFSLHLDRLEGKMTDGKLVVSNLETGTGILMGEETVLTRMTTHEIAKDSFKVDGETSTNGGEKWIQNLRLTYTRSP